MGKVLITHINPHLDDIAGIWLFKKYHPNFKDAKIEFISADRKAALKAQEDQVFVGTGGGQFDEHKEGLRTSAGSLVFEYLKAQGLIPNDNSTKNALEKLMDWNNLVDTGQAPNSEFDAFSVQSFIRSKDNSSESSIKSVELGSEILDRILKVLIKKEQSILDWGSRVEFESKFGKGVAVSSETVDREFCRQQEGDIFLMYDPKYPSVQYFGPEVDLEPIYQKVKELDPQASWFLHQSHHMVICGSSSAPDSKPTKLSFEQLIEAAELVEDRH